MKCGRELNRKITYCSLDDAPPIPCIDIVLHNPRARISVADTAEIDTGFDYGVLLTEELVRLLKISFDGSERIIMPDRSVVACGITDISVKIEGKWFKTKACYSEDILTINPILGREVLNRLSICLRGDEAVLFVV